MSIKTRIQEAKKEALRLERKYHVRENIAFYGGAAVVASGGFMLGSIYGVRKGHEFAMADLENNGSPMFISNTAMSHMIKLMKPGEEYVVPSMTEGMPHLIVKAKPQL